MGVVKGKKNIILKLWKRCRSLGGDTNNKGSPINLKSKPMSENEKGTQIAPNGCFSVHVGPQKQRFVVKTEYANHPLFVMLLEEAEQEYGFESDGPIWLPCNVDLFYKVLAEMEYGEEINNINYGTRRSFAKAKVFPFYVLRSPSRLFCYMSKDQGAYSVMESKMVRINRFQ